MTQKEVEADIYRLHAGARKALRAEALLSLASIILFPLAFCYLSVRRRARVEIFDDGIDVTYFRTRQIDFEDIDRLGMVVVPFRPRGLRGWIETQRCAGEKARHLCLRLRGGKDFSFLLSQYEAPEEIRDRIQEATGLPCEKVRGGFAALIWPEQDDD